MATVNIQPTARANYRALDSSYSDTKEDLLSGRFEFADYPRVGDGITGRGGRSWEVKAFWWDIHLEIPVIEVE
jgi:hypothetical protein